MLEKIKNKYFIQESIPSAYDDSLTWYEVVAKFQAKLNEIIGYINTTLIGKLNEVINDRNTTIKAKINEIITSLTSYLKSLVLSISMVEIKQREGYKVDNTNIEKVNTFQENVKAQMDAISGYSNVVSKTLYDATNKAVVFSKYEEETKTLYLKQGKTTYAGELPTIDEPSNLEIHEIVKTNLPDYVPPEEITSTIEEVKENG